MPYIQLQFRRDTSSNWSSNNPVLASGELGIETNTQQFKLGDGTTAWNSLPYGGMYGPTGATGATGTQGPTGNVGSTGAQGPVSSYSFDGGSPSTNYVNGPGFNCGGVS